MALHFNDPTPIRLRAEDQADQIPAMTFELATSLRALLDEAVQARDLLRRARASGDSRLMDRAQTRLVELHESMGGACDQFERLTRTLRAAGRL